jgi:hypothetical protein
MAVFPRRLLNEGDFDLFSGQVFDYVFDLIESFVAWDVPGVPGLARRAIEKAIATSWRIGATVEEWEELAVQLAREYFSLGVAARK